MQAEWILERPATCHEPDCALNQRPNSGTVEFPCNTVALARTNPTSTPAKVEVEITMKTGSSTIADPGPLDPT